MLGNNRTKSSKIGAPKEKEKDIKKSQGIDEVTMEYDPCPHCGIKRTYKLDASDVSCFWEGIGLYLFKCENPNCEGYAWFFLGYDEDKLKYGKTKWLKPKPYVPTDIATEYKESFGCYEHGYYNAACVMSRRILERILVSAGANPNQRVCDMIKELVKLGTMDTRIRGLCDEIKFLGNMGAHINDEKANKDDADTVLQFSDFLIAWMYGKFKSSSTSNKRP